MLLIEGIKQFVRDCNKLALIYGLFMSIQVLGFLPHIPQPLVYMVLIIFAYFSYIQRETIQPLFLLLLAYIPIEIFIAQPDGLFRPYPRYVLFVLLMTSVAPLMIGPYNTLVRTQLLKILLATATIIGIGSFFCYFLGINYMEMTERDFLENVGYFGGLTSHSMLLGPLSGIAALYMVYFAYRQRRYVYWILVAVCLLTCLFAASRTAVAASVAGSAIMIYKLSNSSSKFFATALVIGVILALTFPLWQSATDGIMQKQISDANIGEFGSRTDLWEARIYEFTHNPIWGVGFVSLDPKFIAIYDTEGGTIEPGSSWLSILSMLGLLGTVIILPIFYKSFMAAWRRTDEWSCLCMGLLSFMFIHMVTEGYIFSAGSFLCFTLWLIVGCCYDRQFVEEEIEDEYEDVFDEDEYYLKK